MTLSVADDLINAIKAAAGDALPDAIVEDGLPVTSDPSDYLAIGYRDDGPAVESTKDFVNGNLDGTIREEGRIWCTAAAWIGETDYATVRARVYAIGDAVAELCRIRGGTDPAFGVTRALWTMAGADQKLDVFPGSMGCAALLQFSIDYEARP